MEFNYFDWFCNEILKRDIVFDTEFSDRISAINEQGDEVCHG